MGNILLVVGDLSTPVTADLYIESVLEGLGHSVTYRNDETADDVTGFDGVVISESVVAATIGTDAKYDTSTVPVITHEAAHVVNLRMTDVNGGANVVMTQTVITNATHPIFKGPYGTFSGTVTFTASASQHYIDDAVANLAAGVSSIAEHTTGTREMVLVCEKGATLTSGVAPDKRAFLWPNQSTGANLLTADGENILRNAYTWAFGRTIFPTTTVLDTFTGADENPITTNWTCPIFPGDGNLQRVSNQLVDTGGTFSNGWYDVSQYGPDCEAWAIIVTKPTTGELVRLFARVKDQGTTSLDGYMVTMVTDAGTDIVRIENIVDGATINVLGAVMNLEFADGDGLGIRCVGNQIEAWHRSGVAWKLIGARTDTTFTNAGYLGIEVGPGAVVLDYFGGGNVSRYATEVLSDNPRGYYRLNEPSGFPRDYSNYALDVTSNVGTPTYDQDGAITTEPETNKSIKFEGAQRFQVPNHTLNDLGDVFTLEAWMKRGGTGTAHTMISKYTNAYHMGVYSDNHFFLAKANAAIVVRSTITVTDTEWHHYVATKNGSAVKLYIDGIDRTGTVTNATMADNASAVSLGGYPDGEYLTGTLDEAAIYPTALSPARVLAHYAAGTSQYANEVLADNPAAYYRLDGTTSAFPATSVLDTFTGANENPIATNWSGPIWTGDGQLQRLSNALTGGASGWHNSYYDIATYGPDSEAYATVTTAPPGGTDVIILWCRTNSIPDIDSYGASFSNNEVVIQRVVAGVGATTLGRRDITIANGDQIGIRAVGNVISAWKNGIEILSVIDTTFTGAGYLAAEILDEIAVLDNFGGGTLSSVVPQSFPQDLSGNDNHVTVQATNSAAGLLSTESNGAMNFDGGGWLRIPDHSSLQITGELSLEAWIKPDTLADYSTIVSKYIGSNSGGYEMYVMANGRIHLTIRGGGTALEYFSSTGEIVAGNTYHIVATYNDSTGEVFLYKNGVRVAATTTSQSLAVNSGLLSIGGRSGGGVDDPETLYFDGVIDEVAIYPSVLSGARVLKHYTTGVGSGYAYEVLADEPVAYYRMDEPSGQPQDYSGYGNNTTTVGGTPLYGQTGGIRSDPTSDAIYLGGSSTQFTAPDHASLDVGDVFTLESWVYRDGLSGVQTIMVKGTSSPQLAFINNEFCLAESDIAVIVTSTLPVSDTGWHHIVATKNGATVKLYLDGADVTGTVTNQTIGNNSAALTLGAGYSANERYVGNFDEVAIYPTALSQERVLAHYYAAAESHPNLTGTPWLVNGSAGSGSTSVIIPSDTNLVVAFWSHWISGISTGMTSLTLNGVAFTELQDLFIAGDAPGVGVAVLPNPAKGSQTFAWTWATAGARSEGGEIVLVFVKGANLSDIVRDSDVDQDTGTNAVTVTLTTNSSDLVLAFAESYGIAGNPGLDGTLLMDNGYLNSHTFDVSTITAGASSTTVNMTGESWSTMAAVAIKIGEKHTYFATRRRAWR